MKIKQYTFLVHLSLVQTAGKSVFFLKSEKSDHLYAIRSDLLRPDITAMYRPVCVVTVVTTLASVRVLVSSLNHESATIGRMQI